MTPKYLETFRRAAQQAQTREISVLSEISLPHSCGEQPGGYLNSLNTLISPPGDLQNPPESDSAACAVCGAADDLWTLDTPTGPVAVHPQCAEFLPKPEPAEPTAAYRAASPDCTVVIIEIPAEGLRYRRTYAHLQLKPPDLVDVDRWRRCIEDARRFLARWGEQAQALNWSSADLFGLIEVPEHPSPSFNRLSRYDGLGLCWALQGRPVVALTENTATIQNPNTGTVTIYRRFNKPALGPAGDSLDDLK
jgi:hypothetical protein